MNKRLLILAVILAAGCTSFANESKEWKFEVSYKSDKFTYTQETNSWDDAYRNAAQACFNYFKSNTSAIKNGEGEAVINACANPKSI